ncbi:MAG: hypothetical protein EHM39_09565, partial [Chloroflexi bacterium]
EPLVAVMALYQRDSTALISLKTKGIQEPADLIGKRILLWNDSVSFKLFAQAAGVDLAEMTLVYPEEDQGIMEAAMLFLSGQVDAMVVPGTDVMEQFATIGIKTNALFLDDYGVANYTNLVVTTEQMIQEQPDVVQSFVSATLLGLQSAVDEPQETAAWFVEHYGDQMLPQQLESQDEALFAVLPLISPMGSKPGMMTRETWQYIYDGGVSLGLFDSTLDFTKAYTLQFVDNYYAASAQRP